MGVSAAGMGKRMGGLGLKTAGAPADGSEYLIRREAA
jgi:hypothetical protein